MTEIEIGNGTGLRSIARRLGRNPSSVSRLLARNRSAVAQVYSSRAAGSGNRWRRQRAVRRARRRRLIEVTP